MRLHTVRLESDAALGFSAVVEVKSLRGNFASLRKRVTSADFVVPNSDEVTLRSLREVVSK